MSPLLATCVRFVHCIKSLCYLSHLYLLCWLSNALLISDTLQARYEGPFDITKTNPNDVTYEIKKFGECNSKTNKAHFEQLKEFIEIPEYLKKHVEFEEYKLRGGNLNARISESPTIPNVTLWETSDSASDSESENG